MQARRSILFLIPLIVFAMAPTPSVAISVFMVFFDDGSAAFPADAGGVISDVVQMAEDGVIKGLRILGHADSTEPDVHALSLKRAETVREKLYRMGLPRSFPIEIRAIGASDPASLGSSVEDRARNRRVQLEFIVGGPGPGTEDCPTCVRIPPN